MTTTTSAAVLHAADKPLSIDELRLADPEPKEILVKLLACGVCHTDIGIQSFHPTPAVLGHEGCGEIVRCGSEVEQLQPGDIVALTFDSCGACRNCKTDQPSHCERVLEVNFGGQRLDGSTTLADGDGNVVHGSFFGQSSFATLALANERNAVKLAANVRPEIAAPLGCGVQTGAGAILNTLDAEPGSSFACFGIGAVGASAIMAAVIRGVSPIIAIDINPTRLALAEALGATHTLTGGRSMTTDIQAIVRGGVDYAFDTAGTEQTFHDAIASTKVGGHTALAAVPQWEKGFHFVPNQLALGRTVTGVLEGSSQPQRFIPQLYEWYEAGRLPIDQLIRTYAFADINTAIEDLHHGRVIKPVLLMA